MIGIIAGTGSLPVEACKSLIAQNKPFFVIALFPDDNLETLTNLCGKNVPVITSAYYKAGSILQSFQQHQATHAMLIGKVDKRLLLKKIKLDWIAVKFFASLLYKSDARIMQGVVDLLSSYGISVVKQDEILGPLKVAPGVLTGSLTPELQADIELGLHTAQALSQHDIGQTVVVKDKMILAVEAIEGTDLCIKRGIELGQTGVVICKAVHPKQNRQFDLPTLGPATLAPLQPGQVKAIAWLADYTFIAQREEFIKQAHHKNITLVSL